jgi:hypothetical protein
MKIFMESAAFCVPTQPTGFCGFSQPAWRNPDIENPRAHMTRGFRFGFLGQEVR